MTRRLSIAAALALSASALSGCMVGPNYHSPEPKAPAQTPLHEAAAPAFVGEEPPVQWWHLFDQPVVDRLVNEALAANTDLRVAAANLKQARAVLRESRVQLFPSTSISASYQHSRQSGASFGQAGSFEADVYDAGIDASYQVDLFGKIARTLEAGRADVAASQATYDLTRVTVVAETIRAYADACAAGRQLTVAQQSLKLQEDTFDLTQRLEKGGRGTGLETSQAGSQLEQTRATVPGYEAQRKAALFRLAVLTGKPPAEFPADVASCETLPTVSKPIPVGDGASLLKRRADVRAAERRLASATAQIGVATADLYPSISLGGSVGSTALKPGDLFSDSGFRFGLGPLISWNFPNIGVAKAKIAQAKAGAEAALATFDGTWLTALQDTETALANYVAAGTRVETLGRAVAQGQEAARIARLRFDRGAEDFQTVLDSERSLSAAEALQATAQSDFSDATISLFLALGGGWQTETAGS